MDKKGLSSITKKLVASAVVLAVVMLVQVGYGCFTHISASSGNSAPATIYVGVAVCYLIPVVVLFAGAFFYQKKRDSQADKK